MLTDSFAGLDQMCGWNSSYTLEGLALSHHFDKSKLCFYCYIVILIDSASQGFLINLSSKIVNLIMAFFSHREPTERESIFTCRSSFTPYVPPEEKISLQDHIPQSVKEERKKDDGIEYLPGERLLIKLGKQREKNHLKKKKVSKSLTRKETVDIDRITQSMSRVLSTF